MPPLPRLRRFHWWTTTAFPLALMAALATAACGGGETSPARLPVIAGVWQGTLLDSQNQGQRDGTVYLQLSQAEDGALSGTATLCPDSGGAALFQAPVAGAIAASGALTLDASRTTDSTQEALHLDGTYAAPALNGSGSYRLDNSQVNGSGSSHGLTQVFTVALRRSEGALPCGPGATTPP